MAASLFIQRMYRKISSIGISVLIILLVAVVNYTFQNEATPPPDIENQTNYGTEWEITGNEYRGNQTIVLSGNLTIKNGGILTLCNVTLMMNSTFSGEFNITVESGGTFNILDGSNLTAFNKSNNYDFWFKSGSSGTIIDSTVEECGHLFGGSGGLRVESDGVIIESSTIQYNLQGIYVWFSSPTLKNNTISNNSQSGIFTRWSSPYIYNNRIEDNDYGLVLRDSSGYIMKNTISNNTDGIQCYSSSPTIFDNNITSNIDDGIFLQAESHAAIENNIILGNTKGIFSTGLSIPIIANNTVSAVNDGIILASYSNATIINSTITSSATRGILVDSSFPNVVNCSISTAGQYDIYLSGDSHLTLLNTTFNKTKVGFDDTLSNLTVQWYMDVYVNNPDEAPLPGATVYVNDTSGGPVLGSPFTTDNNGFVRWIITMEYVQNDTNGLAPGGENVIFYTPHNVTAIKDLNIGYAYPEPTMNASKQVNITLGLQGFFMALVEGWNLVSLPRIQSDTDLDTVLQSIADQYDAVQWYNASDADDHWKHNHVAKPTLLNDLNSIDHSIGFWIYVTKLGGVLFEYSGTQPTENQTITFHPGWNLVGYPSLTNYNRTNGLNNLTFDKEIDSIWAFDAATQKWEEIGEFDYFEIGRGYWFHSKIDCIWEVPL